MKLRRYLQTYVLPMIFGVSLAITGCTAKQLTDASKTFDAKILNPTTQAVGVVVPVIQSIDNTVPISPVHTVASVIMTVLGGVIVLERMISGGLAAAGKQDTTSTQIMAGLQSLQNTLAANTNATAINTGVSQSTILPVSPFAKI